MPIPDPPAPVRRAGTTLWVYNGNDDPCANPLSDNDWSRLAKIKDLAPGGLTVELYDDSYSGDEDADWVVAGQRRKFTEGTSFTLAQVPGEQGQQALLVWFSEGGTRAYKIRSSNGTAGMPRDWVSSIGKTMAAREVTARTAKVTSVGCPSVAGDYSTVTTATGMTVTPVSSLVAEGQSTTLTMVFQPEDAIDKSFRTVPAGKTKATVLASDMAITVGGVAAGKVNIPAISGNGELAAITKTTVADS